MDKRFDGKVVIVNGATKHQGRTVAQRFAVEGAAVACLGRSEADGEKVAQSLREQGASAIYVKTDISQEADVRDAVERVVAEFGRLDVIANVAAATDLVRGHGERPVVEASTEVFDYSMKVNVYGPFWFAKYGIPHMIQTGGGAIVSVSSVAASRATVGLPAYVASKAALEGLMRAIALDYADAGIRANTICLGSISHEATRYMDEDPDIFHERAATRMIQRLGTPEDLAALVTFLASEDASFITAALVPLEGGALSKWVQRKTV